MWKLGKPENIGSCPRIAWYGDVKIYSIYPTKHADDVKAVDTLSNQEKVLQDAEQK